MFFTLVVDFKTESLFLSESQHSWIYENSCLNQIESDLLTSQKQHVPPDLLQVSRTFAW